MSEIVPATSSGYNYASFTGLDLADGEYVVSVIAINEIRMKSERKSEAFHLLTDAPHLSGKLYSLFYFHFIFLFLLCPSFIWLLA